MHMQGLRAGKGHALIEINAGIAQDINAVIAYLHRSYHPKIYN